MFGDVVSCVVVLVTGLPGAGKSTFVSHVVREVVSGGYPVMSTTLTLDGFLEREERSHAFSPEAWQRATRKLFEECIKTVEVHMADRAAVATVADLEKPTPRVRLIFVEDNMYYRSMRERYWRGVCKPLNRQQAQADRNCGVALVEARFAIPRDVCLARNDLRRGSSSFIPPYVIDTMDQLFEPCIHSTPGDICESVEDEAWKWERRHTMPWPLLVHADPTVPAQAVAAAFLRCLSTQELTEALRVQVTSSLTLAKNLIDAQDSDAASLAATYESAQHRLDLALRHAVRCYLLRLGPEEARQRQRAVQQVKLRAAQAFKEERRLNAEAVNEDPVVVDESIQKAVLRFQAELGLL